MNIQVIKTIHTSDLTSKALVKLTTTADCYGIATYEREGLQHSARLKGCAWSTEKGARKAFEKMAQEVTQ